MNGIGVVFEPRRLEEICRLWRITRLGLFGSVLTGEFRPESDVDVLVVFDKAAPWSLFDLVDLQGSLSELFGRKVDLVEESAIRNPYRRRSILASRKVIYEASEDR